MLKNYIKTAFKVFMRRKFFTFISLFGISVTLVVLVLVTTFIDHLAGPIPPEVHQDRSLGVYLRSLKDTERNNSRNGPPSYYLLDRYVRTLPHVEKVSIFQIFVGSVPVFKEGEKIDVYLKRTDGAFWKILAFDFLEGRPFTEQDERDANFVAVINASLREKYFDGEPAVGKMMEVDGQRFRVVGVVRDVPMYRFTPFADIWVPISTIKSKTYLTEMVEGFNAIILAGDASDIPLIKEAFRSRLPLVEFPPQENTSWDRVESTAETPFELVVRILVELVTDKRTYESYTNRAVAVIVAGMVLFMVLPTINLVNINVSRIMERASEVGVRKAFGASSWVLVGQFVVENVVLTLVGGLISFLLSILILDMFNRSGLIPYAQFSLNLRIFLYGLGAALFFGLFSGVYPAWKMSRLHPAEALSGRTR